MKLLGGDDAESQILLKGGNNAAKGQPSLPSGIAAALTGSASATLQIFGSDTAQCYSATLDTVIKDTGDFFKAK